MDCGEGTTRDSAKQVALPVQVSVALVPGSSETEWRWEARVHPNRHYVMAALNLVLSSSFESLFRL